MNFIEGLRRIFLIFSAVAVVGMAFAGWGSRTGYPCAFAWMTDAELFDKLGPVKESTFPGQLVNTAGTHAELASAVRAAVQDGQKARAERVAQYMVYAGLPATPMSEQCPTQASFQVRQAGTAFTYAAATSAALLVLWLLFRWVALGFFPAARRP